MTKQKLLKNASIFFAMLFLVACSSDILQNTDNPPTITPIVIRETVPTATPMPTPTAPILGSSRSQPYPMDTEIILPQRSIKVLERIQGEAAWEQISQANAFNDPPPEGMQYLMLKILVKNTAEGDTEIKISNADFYLTGSHLQRYSPASAVMPDPNFSEGLFPGGETIGWVSFLIPSDETNLIAIIDPLYNFDAAPQYVALDENASISPASKLSAIQPTDNGMSRSDAANLGDLIVTDDWEIRITKIIRGDNAWQRILEANSYNDPPPDGMAYLLVKIYAHYIGDNEDGASVGLLSFKTTGSRNVIYDTPSVVDPEPAFDALLFPDGEIEGWLALQIGEEENNIILIFNPAYSDETKRFIRLEE